jgi:hypothetical protein
MPHTCSLPWPWKGLSLGCCLCSQAYENTDYAQGVAHTTFKLQLTYIITCLSSHMA